MHPERVTADLAARLTRATTVAGACQAAAATIAAHSDVMVAVLLHVHDRLRCVAATGSWQVFASVLPGTGVSGRAYAAGRTQTVTDVTADPDYIALGPPVAVEICAPVVDRSGRPIGVLNLEWSGPVDIDAWRTLAERVAADLGAHVDRLGGPPAESRSEKLLRYAGAMTSAASERALARVSIDAARDVAGLAAAVLLLTGPDGPGLAPPTARPGPLESRLRERLAAASAAELGELVSRAHRHGASYTLGETGPPTTRGYEVLVDADVCTLISVPVGPPDAGGVLLVADEVASRPDPTTVNLMELLAAQAWSCLDRLRSLHKLHEQAISDPLTGLPHHGPFGERIAAATPGRTALLAVDVDNFKTINDTYGHQAGDRVLVGLARALERALRHGDELYRIGGDEFVAVVEVSAAQEAVGIAGRLAGAARALGRTVSVGVAVQRAGESSDLTLRRADAALYTVKRGGGDGVRLAPD
ncbi:diguanylate cyclase [Polymorphospora sp. NPDC051019]|uniref:GGDEF domain-containing protein n=1 Tax=Polymorphospora sp. NPDC051019 TaxID=3155725 RepID=UPI003446D516